MINKTFRLFVSSTFVDFKTERELLNGPVFDHIDSFCQSQGYNFQIIDLRWGVTNESALNQNTVAICIDEVSRCKTLSPEPNFLIMIGERYGWIPLPVAIDEKDMMMLVETATEDERSIISEWYLLDKNAIPPEYHLKPRDGVFRNEETWGKTEAKLRDALLRCAEASSSFPTEKLKRMMMSATELEIEEGLLNNADNCNNTIAVFRNGYPCDADQNEKNKAMSLRKRISQKMDAFSSERKPVILDFNENYSERFVAAIEELLIARIVKEIERLNRERADEQIVLKALKEQVDNEYIFDMSETYARIEEYVSGSDSKPLFIVGDPGSGKSTLLKKFYCEFEGNIYFASYGVNETSFTLVSCLESIATSMKRDRLISTGFRINTANVTESMYELVNSVDAESTVVLILDGIDMMHDIDNIRETVFPLSIPINVKLIASMANGEAVKRFINETCLTYKIGCYDKDKSNKCIDKVLAVEGRRLQPLKQHDAVMEAVSQGASPLQIRLIASICSHWHSFDENTFISKNVEAVMLQHIESMFAIYGHNRELVLFALSLVAALPTGVTEDELLVLLLKFDEVKSYFTCEDRYEHNGDRIPFVIWSRLFYDFKECLTLSMHRGAIVVRFAHNLFYSVVRSNYQEYFDCAVEKLISYYKALPNFVQDGKEPNVRKADGLLYLLNHECRVAELSVLLSDLSFVDAAIRAGMLDGVVAGLSLLIGSEYGVSNQKLIRLFGCLAAKKDSLVCYKNSFQICAEEFGLEYVNENPIQIISRPSIDSLKQISFPYSLDSKVVWSEFSDKYAVCSKAYVYICDTNTGNELSRIYIAPDVSGKRALVHEAVWVSETEIAVSVFGHGVYKYYINEFVPSLEGFISAEVDEWSCIKFSRKHKQLIIQSRKKIDFFSALTLAPLFAIRLNREAKSLIEIFGDELYLRLSSRSIAVFSLVDGKLLKKEWAANDYSLYNSLNKNCIINKMRNNTWTEYSDSMPTLIQYDSKRHKKYYIYPPVLERADKVLLGEHYTVFAINSNTLEVIDIENEYMVTCTHHIRMTDIIWVKKDEIIAMVSDMGLFTLDINNLINGGDQTVDSYFKSSISLKGVWSNMMDELRRITRYSSLLKPDTKYTGMAEYEKELMTPFTNDGIFIGNSAMKEYATIVVNSSKGITAVAYETVGTIVVFGSADAPIMQIDKLLLSVNNNILKMEFTSNSNYLLVWCNLLLKVISIRDKREVFHLDLVSRPALYARFDESDSKLFIRFVNSDEYAIDLSAPKKSIRSLPKKTCAAVDIDNWQFWGPYYPAIGTDADVHPMLDPASDYYDDVQRVNPSKWFCDEGHYSNRVCKVSYNQGFFYLNSEVAFNSHFEDFSLSRTNEQMQDRSAILGFLREKNDLFSQLIQYSESILVLVSRKLNSIIVFDTKKLQVIAGYKFNGNIIGSNYNPSTCILNVAVDAISDYIQIKINDQRIDDGVAV